MVLPEWPVGGVPAEELTAAIARWVDAPAMATLVRHFGGEPPTGPLDARLAALERFSSMWDGRNGGERAGATYLDHPPATVELVRAATRALGFSGRERPPHERYAHVVVHGGGVVTGRARTRFAADLLAGGVQASAVSALGSLRELAVKPAAEAVLPAAEAVQPAIVTEADAMLAGLVEAFPPAGPIEHLDGTTAGGQPWWVRRYASGPWSLSVIAAPPTRPGLRVNTADSLLGWADLAARPTARDRLLFVTTDLYVPFQHAVALATLGLPYRCGIDTVGFSTSTYPAWSNPPSSAGQILQEVRSAILSMHWLYSFVDSACQHLR